MKSSITIGISGVVLASGCATTNISPALEENALNSKQPNILLVMCDDLGFGDVGFNGGANIKTPHLDELAKTSVRFTRFYAGGPVCSPTRGTCLTGRHYIRYGITHANQGRLPVEERTIAEVCKNNGYATGHFGKWHLGTLTKTESDSNRGGKDEREFSPPWLHHFDTCFSTEAKVPTWNPAITPNEKKPNGSPRWGRPGSPYNTAYWNEHGERVQDNLEGCDSRVIMDRAEPFIRKSVAEDKPFLGVIWFHAPHTPVEAGPKWRALYPDSNINEQHYYGCVSAMDAQVGRLHNLLKELNIDKNTIIWFCSDNGPEGSTNLAKNARNVGSTGGLRGRKRSLYDGGVGVPGLLHWPKQLEGGSTLTTPCSTLDILPSMAAAMGVTLPDDRPLDGINILPLLQNPQTERSKPIPYRFKAVHLSPQFAVTDNKWKFLTNLDSKKMDNQLYNMEEDRNETTNLAEEHPEVCARLTKFLEDFIDSARASHGGADYNNGVDMITKFQEPKRQK